MKRTILYSISVLLTWIWFAATGLPTIAAEPTRICRPVTIPEIPEPIVIPKIPKRITIPKTPLTYRIYRFVKIRIYKYKSSTDTTRRASDVTYSGYVVDTYPRPETQQAYENTLNHIGSSKEAKRWIYLWGKAFGYSQSLAGI